MSSKWLSAGVAAVALWGCGAAPKDGGAADAGPQCPVGSHAVDDTCDSGLHWTDGTLFPSPRDHHGTVVTVGRDKAYVYVFGGTPDRMNSLADVWRAPIQSDGMLGEWEQASPLPSKVSGHTTSQIGEWVILSSGVTGADGFSMKTYIAKTQPDGTLDAWRSATPLPEGRFHASAAVHNRTIYVTGGLHVIGPDSDNSPKVLAADLAEDGTLGEWRELRPMLGKRSHHASIVRGDFLYVVGGLKGNASKGLETDLDSIQRAPILPDGSLGEWVELESTLPRPVATLSVLEMSGYLWAIGGIADKSDFTDQVNRAKFLPDGTLDAWEEVPSLPVGRGHVHQTPMYKQWVYSVGGSHMDHTGGNSSFPAIGDVSIGTFQ